MAAINPFIERGRITDPGRFAGRWSELSLIFERLEASRPVLISGPPGIGKSSLLTHVIQSAAVNLELPELHAYYLDMQGAESAAQIYRTATEALRQRGDTLAALELALVAADAPVLLCLDNVQGSIAAGWGEGLLEALARVARGADLFLVVAIQGPPPLLSEPFATLRLGALAHTEVRLLVEAYLDDGDVTFTPSELRQLVELSGSHPAYVQRAAFHLFHSKIDPSIDWRVAYLTDVRFRPIAGAPLPPAAFQGEQGEPIARSGYGDVAAARPGETPQQFPTLEVWPIVMLIVPVLCASLTYFITGNLLLTLAAVFAGLLVVGLGLRSGR